MARKNLVCIADMQVIPVAGRDSMALNLSGAHYPFFTRNLVLIKTSDGLTGIGEIPGGERITQALKEAIPLILGTEIARYKSTLQKVKRYLAAKYRTDIRGNQTYDLRTGVHVLTGIEAACLDILGKELGVPAAELLGDGMQRESVRMLGYLFFIGNKDLTDLPYLSEKEQTEPWYRLRREEALKTEDILNLARAARDLYGFTDFKLKGGVLKGEREIEVVRALKEEFPESRLSLDPNGAWSLEEALENVRGMSGILTYLEDPCGAEGIYSGREIMSEFRRKSGFRTATNMIATDWRETGHALESQAVDIILADPHFWTMDGSVRVAQLCHDFGYTWGSHSNNHFDISLAMSAQVGAAVPGKYNALDTHWIWQEGTERLTKEPFKIIDGCIKLPDKPGLGIEPDMEAIERAHQLYLKHAPKYRDDTVAMQFLIPGWSYNPKKPALVR